MVNLLDALKETSQTKNQGNSESLGSKVRELGLKRDMARACGDYVLADKLLSELWVLGYDCQYDPKTNVSKYVLRAKVTKPVRKPSSERFRGKLMKKKNNKMRAKKSRFSDFAAFLVSKLGGVEKLKQGKGVLDIAGGKGTLSFRLAFDYGIPCTIIDPISHVRLSPKDTTKVLFRAVPEYLTMFKDPKQPVDIDGNVLESAKLYETWLDKDTLQKWDERGKKLESNNSNQNIILRKSELALACGIYLHKIGLKHERMPFLHDFKNRMKSLFEESSALVGLHPDEATEPLVDLAIECNKDFAVVPCCVFPTQNPHRALKDGSPVIQLESFIKYLFEKSESIMNIDVLDSIPGCNTILWSEYKS